MREAKVAEKISSAHDIDIFLVIIMLISISKHQCTFCARLKTPALAKESFLEKLKFSTLENSRVFFSYFSVFVNLEFHDMKFYELVSGIVKVSREFDKEKKKFTMCANF